MKLSEFEGNTKHKIPLHLMDEIKSSGKISILSQFKMAGGEGVRAKVKV